MAESLIAMAGVYAMSYVASYAQKQVKKQIFGIEPEQRDDPYAGKKVVLIPPIFDRRIDRCAHARSPLLQYTRARRLLFNHLFNDQTVLLATLRLKPMEYEGDVSTNTDALVGNGGMSLDSMKSAQFYLAEDPSNIATDFCANIFIPRSPVFATTPPALQTTADATKSMLSKVGNVVGMSRSDATVGGDAIFHVQHNANSNTFANLKFSTLDNGYSRLLSAIKLYTSDSIDTSAFAQLPLIQQNRSSDTMLNQSSRIGLRMDTHNISPIGTIGNTSLAVHYNPLYHGVIGGWVAGYTSHVRGGVEYTYDSVMGADNCAVAMYYSPINNNLSKYTAEQPNYELGIQLDNNARKLTASYYHHMVIRRHVRNPFESKSVVGINNYVDIGLEMVQYAARSGQAMTNPQALGSDNTTKPQLQAAASWQLNRNSLIKARLFDSTASVLYAFKSWFSPSMIVSLSGQYNFAANQTRVGATVMVDNIASVLYGDTPRAYRRVVSSQVKNVTRDVQMNPDY